MGRDNCLRSSRIFFWIVVARDCARTLEYIGNPVRRCSNCLVLICYSILFVGESLQMQRSSYTMPTLTTFSFAAGVSNIYSSTKLRNVSTWSTLHYLPSGTTVLLLPPLNGCVAIWTQLPIYLHSGHAIALSVSVPHCFPTQLDIHLSLLDFKRNAENDTSNQT